MSRVEAVEFPGPLGTLRGMLHRPATPEPWPALMMLHGFTGTRVENDRLFVQAARHFADAGLAVLRFDFYGSGESDGDFEEMTIRTELADAAAALDWLTGQPGIDAGRIGVLGLSMGGAVAALLAGQDPRVRALVLWNAVGLPAVHFSDIPDHGPEAGIVGGLRVGPDFLPEFYATDVVGALRGYAGPGLVVQGGADPVIEQREAEALHAALGDRGTLHIVPQATHTFEHPAWREQVFSLTGRWLQGHLAAGG